jgi:hypothetical protein
VRYVLIALCCGGAALPAEVNPRELVRQSIANGEKAWKQSQAYSCTELDVDEQFEAAGRVKSTDRDLYRIMPVGGDSFQEHVEHDGEAVLERETPRERAARLAKDERERSYYKEITDAFNFKILGEETLPTGPAWVIETTPRRGF